jgi:hypothetical protein
MVQALGPSYTQEELHSTLHRLEVVEGMLGVEDKLIDDDKLKEGDGHNLLHKLVLIHKVFLHTSSIVTLFITVILSWWV